MQEGYEFHIIIKQTMILLSNYNSITNLKLYLCKTI